MKANRAERGLEAGAEPMFEANPLPMWIYDLETLAFLDVNDAAIAHYGWSREEFLSMTIRDIRPPDDVPALLENVSRVTGGLDQAGIWRHLRKDGSVIAVEIISHTLEFRGRRAECVLASDVTARLRMESALAAIAGAAASTGDGSFHRTLARQMALALDVRHAIVGLLEEGEPERVRTIGLWSDGALRPEVVYELEGTPCANVVGKEVCFYPRGVQALFPDDAMLGVMEAESYLGVPLFDAARRPVGILVVVHDRPLSYPDAARSILSIFAGRAAAEIERERAEAARRQSDAARRALLEAMPDLMFRMSRDGVYLDVQAPSSGGLALPPERFLHRSVAEVMPADLARRSLEAIVRTLETRRLQTFEYELEVDGGPREWEARLSPLGEDQVVALVRDVTERKRLEQRVLEVEKLESLQVLAAGVAHDFNNLLSAIHGYAELAASRLPEGCRADECVHSIEIAARRGAELVQEMLVYSGKGRIGRERSDVNAIVREIARLVQAGLPEGARLVVRLAEGLPPVEGDPARIRQAVRNILTNAVESLGGGGGTVTLSTCAEPPEGARSRGHAGERLEKGPSWVRIEVSDTGCGMDAATLGRIFDPFFTTKFAGRGLGLAASRGIARSHGGEIQVESEAGRGSIFRILLPPAGAADAAGDGAGTTPGTLSAPVPVAKPGPAPSATAGPGAGASEGLEGMLVLVVDDEDLIRLLAQEFCGLHGIRTIGASGGREALRILAERAPAVSAVLLDMTMPEMGGPEVLREIRRLHPGLPVILMSGYTEQDIQEAVSGEGAAGFLQKPFLSADLAAKLREVLRVPA